MANQTFAVAAPSFFDTLSTSGLETLANAQLASLLTDGITGISFTGDDLVRGQGTELKLILSYVDGQSAIANPYVMKGFVGKSVSDISSQVSTFMTANPTYFFSPVFHQTVELARKTVQVYAILFYNIVLADGELNWYAGGNPGGLSPGGAAGGDLSGTYPNPAVFVGQLSATPGATTTTLDSAVLGTYKTIAWEFEAIKGTNTYSSRINASHDGTTSVFVESDICLAPSIGTFDITTDVDVSGGSVRLRITTASGGWTLRSRRISQLAA